MTRFEKKKLALAEKQAKETNEKEAQKDAQEAEIRRGELLPYIELLEQSGYRLTRRLIPRRAREVSFYNDVSSISLNLPSGWFRLGVTISGWNLSKRRIPLTMENLHYALLITKSVWQRETEKE